MKILALIPARSGSKRLPGKNIKTLGNRPLIAWTIKAALDYGDFCDVVVSTDSENIAEFSKKYGASVPWLRPSNLAADHSTSMDVVIHALDEYERDNGKVDGLLLLQPTSPFRTAKTIKKAVDLYTQNKGKYPVVGVSRSAHHPAWCFKKTQNGLEPFMGWEFFNKNSQELEESWVINGSIYLISPERLRKENVFFTFDTLLIASGGGYEDIDIDTPEDWEMAIDAIIKNNLSS